MRKASRKGFTLPEVLVTVTIVAVLAAVMVPAVINQVSKGDSPAVSNDISGIRTAITTFAADTRHFPKLLSQLGGSSLSSASVDIINTAYGTDSANYHGPYATISAGHVAPNGAIFSDSLMVPASTRNVCLRDSTTTGGATGNSNIKASQIAVLESALDGTTATPKTTGAVQWVETTPGTIDAGSVRVCVTTY